MLHPPDRMKQLPEIRRPEDMIQVIANHSRKNQAKAGLMWTSRIAFILTLLFLGSPAGAQQLLNPKYYRIIRDNSSGELPYADFKRIVQFPGFFPSPGADQVADYLATQARSFGMSDVTIEHYAADGERYVWAFRTEPSWSVAKAQLWLEEPERQLLSDYKVYRGVIGRFSRSASVSGELVDVGAGNRPEDYEGRSVEGKIVLASGGVSAVTRLAVWQHKALGILDYRTEDAINHPDLISSLQLAPWEGPQKEQPTFAFSLSYRQGMDLRNRLADGERVVVRAEVDAETKAGAYPEVLASIPGTDPELPVVLVYAHDNSRNTGGANNLTGVGCTVEIARMLSDLISSGKLPRPRRTIRFMWGPEHYGTVNHFHEHPEDISRILAMINIDMIGYDQDQNGAAAVLHLYRSPYSNPSFIDDIVQAFLGKVGEENTISIRNAHFLSLHPSVGFLDPIFAPTGSDHEFHYNVEPYWGPSDHEDAQTLGIRAILLNDYPDYFLGTQDDSPEAAGDPTQMRRGVVVGATAAYFLSSASANDIPALLENALTKAEVRLAADESRAYSDIGSATADTLPSSYYEARNIILQGFTRELVALKSLSLVAADSSFDAQCEPFSQALEDSRQKTLKRIDEYARVRARQLNVSSGQLEAHSINPEYTNAVPVRASEIRGPVNIFRPEYGRWWLVDKTGDEHFDQKLSIAKRGEYAYYEALNLANGKRNVSEIRDVLSAEFEPMPASEVYEFFKFMEGVGVVQIQTKK
jgi:aminopeptidase YwaD